MTSSRFKSRDILRAYNMVVAAAIATTTAVIIIIIVDDGNVEC